MHKRKSRSRSRDAESNSQLATPVELSDSSIDESTLHIVSKKRKQIKSTKSEKTVESQINYPKVESVLLELPYRGLFDFENANTYETLPDQKFVKLFNKMVSTTTSSKTPVSNDNTISKNKLKSIRFNDFEIDTWYKSPYPSKYTSNTIMHICPHCLAYYDSQFTLHRHLIKCSCKHHPDGREIYRDEDEKISVFEIDGRKNVIFCQNLCLLAKLFLNSKTLYYDVEPFMFYVLYDFSGGSFNVVGYFSKEKLNSTGYNLSCIMTLPIYQRRGFGSFLIEFSYLLSRREFKTGSPEKPLSHMGLLSYRNYWKISVIRAIHYLMYEKVDCVTQTSLELDFKDKNLREIKVSIDDISNLTGMCHDDVIVGLEQLSSLLAFDDGNKIKYALIFNFSLVKQLYQSWQKKSSIKLNSDLLYWKPVILGPSGGINTNSTMVVTGESNDDNLMKDISIIYNFLQDDLEDDRDIEDQILEKVMLQQKDPVSEFSLFQSSVCYPGMKFIKRSVQVKKEIFKTDINKKLINNENSEIKAETEIDEDAVKEIFNVEIEDDNDDSSHDYEDYVESNVVASDSIDEYDDDDGGSNISITDEDV